MTSTTETTHFAIVDTDTNVYGVGATEEQAWADAREWADRDSSGNPILTGFASKPCSAAVAAYVIKHGSIGVFGRVAENGGLYLRSELAYV